jgi:hypothetical protein
MLMNTIDFPIEKINKFLETHIFEVYLRPTHDENYSVPTNVKVKLTGVKEYISIGDNKPFVQYTIYILPTNESSDAWSKMYGDVYGNDVTISTTSQKYANIRWIMENKLSNFLKYFGVDKDVICTRVINEVEPQKMNESLILEGQLDKTTRKLVKDIIAFFKHQREGEFELPEDTSNDEMVYELPGFNNFSIFLDLQLSDDVDTFDVDGDLYYDDDLLYITIISNPNTGYNILDELTKELNEVIRHELEHIKQNDEGYEFPKKEPKSPEKYYTQQHELEAQRAGFNKRAKSEKTDFETVVRNWFKKNPHKHTLKPNQQEKVIQQIINKNV